MIITSKQHTNKHKLQDPYLEKDLQGKIGRWLNNLSSTVYKGGKFPKDKTAIAIEIKLVTGGSLAFSKFEDQQLPCLMKVIKNGLYHKLTDASIGCKPFDCFLMRGNAYVLCQFWKNIQQEVAYFMDIKEVIKIKESGKKSLKETDFMQFGTKINLADYKVGIKKK